MEKVKKITGYRLFLPLSCLLIVLLINLITTPTFFKISTRFRTCSCLLWC